MDSSFRWNDVIWSACATCGCPTVQRQEKGKSKVKANGFQLSLE
jgi:hypothetical protein